MMIDTVFFSPILWLSDLLLLLVMILWTGPLDPSYKKLCFAQQATTWHDDYNRFRAGVKDLEVMVQNLMSSAFETITTVQEGVEILDIFKHLSSREVRH